MAFHGSQTLRMPVESTGGVELEASNDGHPLYPSMIENPQLFWQFTRKVYAMLAIQLLISVAVAALVISRPAIPKFVLTKPGMIVYIFTLIVSFILLYPLQLYHKEHPVNLVLLMLLTTAIAFAVGLTCSFSMVPGRVILLAGILKSVAVVSLTLHTFWAEKKGYEFNFLGPFLIASVLVLIVFALIQIFIPLGNLRSMIIGG